jgi:hypothetical protein
LSFASSRMWAQPDGVVYEEGEGSGGDVLVCCDGFVFGELDSVLELHAVEHVGDELVAVEPPPAFLGGVAPASQGTGKGTAADLLSGRAGVRCAARLVATSAPGLYSQMEK